MEPEGDSLSPGDSFTPVTSYGPPPSFSTQDTTTNTFLNSTLQVSDKLTLSGNLWSRGGDGDFERSEGPLSWVEPGRSAQRSVRPSAFPSSLTWDSDSEKETLDEEELQHFSNPHGLAAHSPGSPSSGLRPESDDDQAPENLESLLTETNIQSPMERQDQEQTSTHSGEPNEAQPSSVELLDDGVWNVSEKAELFQSKVKPKEVCHVKEEREEEDIPDMDKELERDVYTFPGDSDPDSPPPAPWAHCTFIQRRKKKRALLRPFSGQCAWESTSGAGRKARGACPKAGSVGSVKVSGGVYDFKEEEEAVEKPEEVEDGSGTVEGGVGELSQEIYTCVECSIYFKKQVYLQEHMEEHSLSREGRGKGGRFRCVECGWNLPNRLALADHHRRHQESRQKIVEEIGKLSGGGKAENTLGEQMKVTEPARPIQRPLVAPVTITVPDSVPVPVGASVKAQVKTPVKAKVKVPASRRFLCLKCDFSTRTSQALANHAKTHNRKPSGLQRASPRFQPKLTLVEPPGPSRGGASTSLTCDQCAFQASSQIALKKHQHLAHSAQTSISGDGPEEMGYPGSPIDSSSTPSCENVSKHVPQTEGQSQSKACRSSVSNWVPAEEDSGTQSQPTNDATAPQCREVAFKTIGNKRTNRRGRVGTEHLRPIPRLDCRPSDSQDAQSQSHSNDLASEMTRKEMVGSKPLTRARSIRGLVEVPALAMQLKRTFTASLRGAAEHLGLTEGQQAHLRHSLPLVLTEPLGFDCQTPLSYLGCWERGEAMEDSSLKQQSLVTCYSEGKPAEEEEEEDEEPKAVFKKKSNKVFAAENDGDVDHDGHNDDEEEEEEEKIRRFLAEGVSDEDYEEMDDETGTLKRVERKCPYCPDRFHNGIGLANHVRGHLNRVGVSYNVRHFISPEEVNAIEKKFSYQKKKKKVANFDPDTFSVMRCEFCSAGFDTRAGLSSHARAHLRDFGITNWEVTVSPIHILRELFSSRPDLVLPMAPPHNPASDEEDEDEDPETDKEEPGGVEEGEETTGASVSNLPPSSPCQPWKKESSVSEPEGGEEEEQMPVLDSLTSSPGRKRLFSHNLESPSLRDKDDIKGSNLLKCEVCSAPFETRRGLSSHARSHLRQLGIGMSESSGAPIDLLYQITKERSLDGHFPPPSPRSPATKNTPRSSPAPQEESCEDTDVDEKPIRLSILAKAVKVPTSSTPSPVASPAPPSSIIRSCSPSPVVRKAPISSLLPVSSPLRCLDHKPGGMKGTGSNLTAKPFWAPQETDAPLNLTLEVDPNKDIVCQLCGAWFETRKGLSSHARAHLRHFGVEYSESKGSPIDLLNQLIHTDDFKHRASALQPEGLRGNAGLSSPKRSHLASTSPHYRGSSTGDRHGSKATSASASSVFGPPPKRPKSSQLQVFRLSGGELLPIPHSEPVKEIGCEFCGEYFENRKGLSSHARSHLRQMGITEWSVNGSPIDTLRELITRRGLPCALPLKPLTSPPPSPGPPRSPMSSSSSPSLLSRLPFAFAHPPSRQSTVRKMSSAPSSSAGLIVKLKPEPMQLEISVPGGVGGAYASEPLNCSWSSSDNMLPLNLVTAHEAEPTRDIRCEFCGEYFENRKGLSSHARSHLRQMGITEWSVNGSPIDTLRELMHKRGGASPPGPGVKKESSQRSSPTWECLVGGLGYQSPKLSRKSPLNLLHSGSRLHKHGLGAVGLSSTPPAGKFSAVSPLGKRSLSEEGRTVGRSSPHPQPKTFSPAPHDLSFKGKSSPEKHAGGHLDASCELCGFYFENRKALASHARAHLRQFGVTEWCVNGSPIETLSAWMRSRPHKVVEMHRGYMQGSARSTPKKKSCSSPSSDSDLPPPLHSQKPSSSQWAALGLAQARRIGRELTVASPRTAEGDAVNTPPSRLCNSSPARLSNALSPHAQVARSELNVRLPRGFERRPPKHPSHSEGGERDSGSPKPPRTSTIPALVPKPPCTPLVKVVGKIYNLKCRFCEVEFQGPLSVQEDWIRHLQQHILNLNYNKPAPSATDQPAPDPRPTQGPAATPSFTATPDPTSAPPPIHTTAPTVPTPTSPPPSPVAAPGVTATPMATASTEPAPTPAPIPVATTAL